jgi:prevent-host-death family protein
MSTVNMHEAKTQFSKLVEAVMHGEEIIIAKAGKPAARLIPYTSQKPERRFGVLKGKITIADDFDAPMPEEFLNDFEDPK